MSEFKSQPESQKDRWLKYGTNVVISSAVVMALAIVLIFIAQRHKTRWDTTAAGNYSLKPQTIAIIKDLKSPVKIYSLYTRPDEVQTNTETDYAQTVSDLLDEYKRNGSRIEVETIDPRKNPTKVDQLIEEVTQKYGGEVKKYREFVAAFPEKYDQIKKLTNDEAQAVSKLSLDAIQSDELVQSLSLAAVTVQGFPKFLDNSKKVIDKRLGLKPPDYRGATLRVQEDMRALSEMVGQIVQSFQKSQKDPKVPDAVRAYIQESLPRYEALKKTADDVDAQVKSLGELKLDDLRQKLRERDAILVMGDTEMRSLSFNQVWSADPDRASNSDATKMKPKFAGEQQITSAILSLTSAKKPKVVFLRPGGAPLASAGFPPFQPGGPLSRVADRLRDYNFEVLEKDLSGQWAARAQMQGMPAEPEPSDDDLKDAIWIVLSVPAQQQMPTPPIAPKLAEHLKAGGAALCMFLPQSDNLGDALADYGITVRTDLIAVHEPIKTGSRSADMIEEAQKVPFIFVTNQYGDHLITRPLRSLDAILIPLLPVQTTAHEGLKTTSILPVPSGMKTWGEHDIEATMNGDDVQFSPDKGDISGPLFGGAVAEKANAGRVVALGSLQFVTNQILNVRDPELAQRGIFISRFPGNAELFLNSIFWLGKMEPMLAISPAAMEVSRLEPISDGMLRFWRIGVLLVGLPALVVVAGAIVYVKRRD